MNMEIELKLLAPENARQLIESHFLPELTAQVTTSEAMLFNQYFDTPQRLLRKHDIGLRIRANNQQYEQTLKTAGSTVGGLHQRPEYNVPLPDCNVVLALFDPTIWPADLNIVALQKELSPIFTTHFKRNSYLLTLPGGAEVELVVDKGKIASDSDRQDICELELELKHGEADVLFDLAAKIVSLIPVRIGNLSKAARGYSLAYGNEPVAIPMPRYLPLNKRDDIGKAFCLSLEFALSYWQSNEQLYLYGRKNRKLLAVVNGIELALQVTSLYSPLLKCPEISGLAKRLSSLKRKWAWLDQYLALRDLRSKKGPFHKKMHKNPDFLSYLHGRCDGVLKHHCPNELILASENVLLQLELSRLLVNKPWQSSSADFTSTLQDVAAGGSNGLWQKLKQNLSEWPTVEDYLQSEDLIRSLLRCGFFCAALNVEKAEPFLSAWWDIADGIDELKTLGVLQQELCNGDIVHRQELSSWCEKKMNNVLTVMQQSLASAQKIHGFW
jgi:triphosphatase